MARLLKLCLQFLRLNLLLRLDPLEEDSTVFDKEQTEPLTVSNVEVDHDVTEQSNVLVGWILRLWRLLLRLFITAVSIVFRLPLELVDAIVEELKASLSQKLERKWL